MPDNGTDTVIQLNHIVKRFFVGRPNELEILHGINLEVKKGEFVSIVGESGSGKSTLMNIIGALDKPTEGDYRLDGTDVCRAKELLEMVGMEERMLHKSDELSGGQKQRVAIARAMANNPSIILADEPTGSLDSRTGRIIMDIFHRLHREEGKTIVFITHSPDLAKETERIITLSDGLITDIREGAAVC